MGWRCWRVRKHLALLVGDDLSEREKASVQIHLDNCLTCREHLAALERSREAMLGDFGQGDGAIACASLWPSLRSRIMHASTPRTPRQSWLPVGALAAASLAIATILWNRPAGNKPTSELIPASNSGPTNGGSARFDLVSVPDQRGGESLTRLNFPDDSPPVRSYFHLEKALPVGFSPQDF